MSEETKPEPKYKIWFRFGGWLWLPIAWTWRGCFDWGAARSSLISGLKEMDEAFNRRGRG